MLTTYHVHYSSLSAYYIVICLLHHRVVEPGTALPAQEQAQGEHAGVSATVAGTGIGGYGGNGSASHAQLYVPIKVAVDTVGNIIIAAEGNCRIRKVTTSTGVITTIAGDGTVGFGGDGSVATNAQLQYPLGIGSAYAQLQYPLGIAVDTVGSLVIADTNYYRIRKMSASMGVISTIAGDITQGFSGDGDLATNAWLYKPTRVAVDTTGKIYIADFFNRRVRKLTASTGVFTAIAGTVYYLSTNSVLAQ